MAEVLIVDDDPDIRGILAFTMEDAGYAVREAGDGAQAITAMEKKAPDCLVLDLMMPGVDGFGVLRSKRQLGIAPEARVLILTCKTAERDHVRGWERGADEHLTKPFDPDELVDKVKELLELSPSILQDRRAAEPQEAALLE